MSINLRSYQAFQFLEAVDLGNIARISKHWNKVSLSHILWEKTCFKQKKEFTAFLCQYPSWFQNIIAKQLNQNILSRILKIRALGLRERLHMLLNGIQIKEHGRYTEQETFGTTGGYKCYDGPTVCGVLTQELAFKLVSNVGIFVIVLGILNVKDILRRPIFLSKNVIIALYKKTISIDDALKFIFYRSVNILCSENGIKALNEGFLI